MDFERLNADIKEMRRRNRGLGLAVGALAAGQILAPVSYTHLDVYKRQAQAQLNDAKSDLRLARRITIFGRTDSTGPLAFNEELALARALAVRDYLRQTHLTLAAKLTLKAQGACCFIASNDTVAGRTLNRRVEVVVHRSEEDPP